MKHGNLLTGLILVALVLGALFGQFVLYGSMGDNPNEHWTKLTGDLVLIRPLFLLIIPLIFVSVIVGMTSIGDPSKLGVVGSSTVLYYLVTMLIAVSIGTILVTTFRPGDLPEETRVELRGQAEQELARSDIAQNIAEAKAEGQTELGGAWFNILRQLVPKNIVASSSGWRLPRAGRRHAPWPCSLTASSPRSCVSSSG
jgi:Na+/H+-dicarboxylate symporter